MLGTFVGGTGGLHPQTLQPIFSFDVVDLDADEVARIDVDFLPHGFTTKPGSPHIAAVFEKRGPGAALLDLAEMRLIGRIRALPGRHYYGHGVFSRDGEHLFVVEIDLETRAGLLSVRETNSYREIYAFPTYGDRPHDCVLIDDGKVLVITNGGGNLGSKSEPCVTYVDVASRKLLEKIHFSDPKINAGHVAIRRDGALAVVSAPRDGLPPETSFGGITLRSPKRKPERMRGPNRVMDKVIGEALSVVMYEDTVAVTNPLGGIVTFWSFASKKLVGFYECENPRGVELTHDRSAFVVSFGKHASVVLLDVHTFKPVERGFGDKRLGGSHIFLWERAA